MHTFTDKTGATWGIEVDFVALRRIEQETGYQVLRMFVPEEMERLASDPMLLVTVICSACSPQIQERELSEDQFLQRLSGDNFQDAVDALENAVIDFMPEKKKALIREVKATNLSLQRKNEAFARENLKLLERLDSERRQLLTQKLDKELEELHSLISSEPLGNTPGTTPESRESSRDTSP